MKTLTAFISLLILAFTSIFGPAQAKDLPTIEEQLQQTWVLQHGWLTDDHMIFSKADDQENEQTVQQVFTFAGSDVMNYQTQYPNGTVLCGTGMLNIDEAYWSTNGEMMTLVVKGGHIGVDYFEYVIQYVIEELTNEHLKLTKYRTIMAKEQSFLSL